MIHESNHIRSIEQQLTQNQQKEEEDASAAAAAKREEALRDLKLIVTLIHQNT